MLLSKKRERLLAAAVSEVARTSRSRPRARRQRQDAGDHQDRDDLVDLGADQHEVAGQVGDVVAGNRRVPSGSETRHTNHSEPADRGRAACGKHEARLEAQRAQRDEDEDIHDRRRLQVEGGRLHVLDVEAPDHGVEEQHVEEDRDIDGPVRNAAAQAPGKPKSVRDQVDADRIGRQRHAAGLGLWRNSVENAPDRDDQDLEQLDEYFAAVLLFFDGRGNLLGQVPGYPRSQDRDQQPPVAIRAGDVTSGTPVRQVRNADPVAPRRNSG